MLKSTYKPPVGLPPIPEGWTQHKAPGGKLAERTHVFELLLTGSKEPPTTTTRLLNNRLMSDLSNKLNKFYSHSMQILAEYRSNITMPTLQRILLTLIEAPLNSDL